MNLAKTGVPGQLEFSYAAMEQEISAFSKFAKPYLERDSVLIVQRMIDDLKSASTIGNAATKWEVSQNRPIRTIVSKGEYMPEAKGEHHVRAELSFVWGIENVMPSGPAKKKKLRHPSEFRLTGLASSVVSVFRVEDEENEPIAKWQFDLGAPDSPGCFFHVQILGDHDIDKLSVFPKSLDIPRLPSLLFTPMDALEFALGELFQDRWMERSRQTTNPAFGIWRKHQGQRLSRLFTWKQNILKEATALPWSSIKNEKPPSDLFSRKEKK